MMREHIHFTIYLPADGHFYFKYLLFEWELNKLHHTGEAKDPKLGESVVTQLNRLFSEWFFFF